MRDAIGGTWLMGIVLVFVVLFSSFLAFAVNYSKAFKVKNEIINIIEKSEGYTTQNTDRTLVDVDSTEGKIKQYLNGIGYNTSSDLEVKCPNEGTEPIADGNYCVTPITDAYGEKNELKTYYTVTTFVIIEFPFFNGNFNIPISGETKRIYNDKCDLPGCS